MEYEKFRSLFRFAPERAGLVGVERECFITQNSRVAPLSPQVIAAIGDPFRFGFELSACQLEERIPPSELSNVMAELQRNEVFARQAEELVGFGRLYSEVGPADMPLDVYPDPTGRYQQIAKQLSLEVLSAACRVIGTHIHIGMPDHETACRVYNVATTKLSELCELGNGSFGERLKLYRLMAPRWEPMPYENWGHFFEVAMREGFANDPKQCWTFIRISIHGTIEFRMFGSTASLERVISWAKACHSLCMEAMR